MRTVSKSAAPRIRATLTAVAVMLALIAVGPARADTQDEISETERKLDEIIARIDTQSASLTRLEGEANNLAADINAVTSAIAVAEARIAVLQGEIRQADSFLAGLQTKVDDRAWEVYQAGAGNELEILLGSTTFQDFAARLEFVGRAAESDADLYAEIENRRNQLAGKKKALEREEASLRDQNARLVEQQRALEAKLADVGRALDQLSSDRSEAESLLQQLKDRRAQEHREDHRAEHERDRRVGAAVAAHPGHHPRA